MRWGDLPETRGWAKDAADHSGPIPMSSHYFAISEDGATSYLQKQILDLVLGGDMRMMLSYNRHGQEQCTVVQIICDVEVVTQFIRIT